MNVSKKPLIINLEDLVVQCDYYNQRMKILNYQEISPQVFKEISNYARAEGVEKILVNCPKINVGNFLYAGFLMEGVISGYYKGTDAYCLAYYIDPLRKVSTKELEAKKVLDIIAINNSSKKQPVNLKKEIRKAEKKDIKQIIDLYKDIFITYPTPIFERAYIEQLISGDNLFKVAIVDNKVVSTASAEVDWLNFNAEITDCATASNYTGQGLLTELIVELEKELESKAVKSLYSLCRATEIGINKSLKNLDYQYKGCLINNCNIAGDFEDMNVWSKYLG